MEVAILNLNVDQKKDLEVALGKPQITISGQQGFVSHQLQKCIEQSSQYILLVKWQTFEYGTAGFRQSEQYQEWRGLLHHFYDPFPSHFLTMLF